MMSNDSGSMLWESKLSLSLLSGSLMDSFTGGENPVSYHWHMFFFFFVTFVVYVVW